MYQDNDIVKKYYITSETDLDGIILKVSDAFCKISGYTREELIGQKHSIVRHPDTNKNTFTKMWKTIKSGNIWTGVIKNKKKNGDAYLVDSYIEPIYKDKKIIGYSSVRYDVSAEYKLAEVNSTLLASVRKFEKLFDSIDSGVAVVDSKGNYIDVNAYLCTLMGYTKEEFLSGNLLTHPDNKSDIQALFKNMIIEMFNLNHEEEKECLTKSGDTIWIKEKYRYFCEDKIIITIQDISSAKKLNHASSLLIKQSKDADMGEMISMIAHQWRQPLATIDSILAKIKAKRELKVYSGENLTLDTNKIASITTHLSKTIDFFRDYLRPKIGIKKPFKEIYETVNVIINPLYKNEQIFFNISMKGGNFQVDERIDQVLLNIYKNSLDAYIQREKKGNIDTEVYKKDEKIIIKITDYAGGVDSEILEKILDPYFSTKSKNGTGLGLYMCKNIITDILYGSFYFKNNVDGISFYIELSN